jgi:hypothetical protein
MKTPSTYLRSLNNRADYFGSFLVWFLDGPFLSLSFFFFFFLIFNEAGCVSQNRNLIFLFETKSQRLA